MGYPAQQGVAVTLHHPVRDPNYNYLAGQAAAVTKTLLRPDRQAAFSSELPTLVDEAVGWVAATLTLTQLGTYTLFLKNPDPPIADGNSISYDLTVAAGVSPGQSLLTSLDRVRTRMQLKNAAGQAISPGEAHPFDSLINLLISEVSDEYQQFWGRNLAEASYTEYLDGTGRSSLVLGAGPLVSVTSVEFVDYQDNGAGGVTEVRTLLLPSTYVVAGLRTQPRYTGLGRIDLLGSSLFTRGPRRYRVIYTAGFAVIPEAVVGLATTDVVFRLMTRDTGHLLSQALGEGSITYLRPQQMVETREAGLAPYRLEAA